MDRESFRIVERAVLDVFRYGDGWMLRRRGDPGPGVVVATRQRAIELGAARASLYADAELVIRDRRGNVDEVHRLGLIARRHSRRRASVGADEEVPLATAVEPTSPPSAESDEDASSARGLAGSVDAA